MKTTISLLSAALVAVMMSAAFAQDEPEHTGPRDTDGDGNISRAESEAFQQEIFDELDGNQDGFLSFEEFLAPSNRRFDAIDANGDDLLSRDERIDAFLEAKGNRKERRKERRKGDD